MWKLITENPLISSKHFCCLGRFLQRFCLLVLNFSAFAKLYIVYNTAKNSGSRSSRGFRFRGIRAAACIHEKLRKNGVFLHGRPVLLQKPPDRRICGEGGGVDWAAIGRRGRLGGEKRRRLLMPPYSSPTAPCSGTDWDVRGIFRDVSIMR